MPTKEKTINAAPWRSDTSIPSFPELEGAHTAEIAIIGGGLAGIFTAYLLAKAGKKVVLIEKGRVGEGATGDTTAFLTQAIDTDFSDLLSLYGTHGAGRISDSHGKAIDLIEEVIKEENIKCEFMRCENILFARHIREADMVEREFTAMKHIGLPVSRGKSSSLPFPQGGFLRLRNQGKFHPLKFLFGLAKAAEKYGAKIYRDTLAQSIEEGGALTVWTSQGKISTPWVITATYQPFRQPLGLFFKKGMYITYVYELRAPLHSLPEGIYEDFANPYNYFRVDHMEKDDRIIIGGDDHRADIKISPEKNFRSLAEYARNRFPGIDYRISRYWRGPILEPIDGLAHIGHHKNPRILYAFGFSGNGMTYSAITALMMRAEILGERNPWREIYAASRIPAPRPLAIKGRDYLGELVGGAVKNAIQFKRENRGERRR